MIRRFPVLAMSAGCAAQSEGQNSDEGSSSNDALTGGTRDAHPGPPDLKLDDGYESMFGYGDFLRSGVAHTPSSSGSAGL